MSPYHVCTLILGTCEYVTLGGKRNFPAMIKVTDFELRKLDQIIQVDPV